MKRYGNLYEQIYSMDNLRKAHKNARKGKGWYEEVKEVDANIEVYLKQLQELIMSRTFTHKTDESTLTTLCPRCLNAFRNTRGIRVRRADPYQLTKEPCTYCQTNFGYDYYIQPTSPKSTYFKKGRFDDESECA